MMTLQYVMALALIWFVLSLIQRKTKVTKADDQPAVPATESSQMLASDMPPALVASTAQMESVEPLMDADSGMPCERKSSQYDDFDWFRPLLDLSQFACTWVVEQLSAHRPTRSERLVDVGLAMAGVAYGYGPKGRVIFSRTSSNALRREPMAIRIVGAKRQRTRVLRAMQKLRPGGV